MSEAKKEPVSRRGFMKTAATGIVGLAVGAGIGYGAASSMAPAARPGATVTTTVTATAPGAAVQFPFNLPRKGTTVAERAVNAAKFLLEQHPEWKGTELVLACVGGYEFGFNAMKPLWESATGTKLTVTPIPLPEFFDKMMVEAVSKTGSYDLMNCQTMYFSDLAESGLLYQLDDSAMWIDIREHGRPDGYVYPLGLSLPRYKGKLFGFLQDGDVQTLYYRSDYWNDPKEKEGFEKQYGYPLAPPKTFFEYRDMAKFFTRPEKKLYGHCEGRELTRNCFSYYLYVTSKLWPNWYYFDDNMKPQLTSKEAIEAIQLFVETTKYAPPNLPELMGQAAYMEFAEGRTVLILSAPSTGNVIQQEKAVSRNKWDTAPMPGYWVTTPDGKKILNRRSVNLASWSLTVNNYGKKRDLAVCAGAFMCDPENLIVAMTAPGTWHDPTRYNHVGVNAPAKLRDVKGPVLGSFEENATIMAPMLSGILGATEYNVTLSKNLHAAMLGSVDPVKTMETSAKAWDEITDRLGRQKQLDAWLQVKKFYPTTTL